MDIRIVRGRNGGVKMCTVSLARDSVPGVQRARKSRIRERMCTLVNQVRVLVRAGDRLKSVTPASSSRRVFNG